MSGTYTVVGGLMEQAVYASDVGYSNSGGYWVNGGQIVTTTFTTNAPNCDMTAIASPSNGGDATSSSKYLPIGTWNYTLKIVLSDIPGSRVGVNNQSGIGGIKTP